MSSPSPPPAPDPVATAAAQAKYNKESALTQQQTNMTNQITPYGNLTYSSTGETWPDGTPRFTATQGLSPGEQEIYDINQATRRNVGTIGRDQSARIGQLLSQPVKLGNEATEARLMELGSARLNPQFAQRRSGLESKLANQGITMGSEAWRNATTQLDQQENDAYNQLLLTGRGQANQELLTERNQPLNEITALMSGSQVSQPNWVGTPQTSVAPIDYAGIVQNNFDNQFKGYQSEQGEHNAMMGGLFGLASAPLGGWASGGFKPPKFS